MSVKAEARQFTVHPAIIKSIIHEQAGSFDKAVSELIMNSVDAGADTIDIQHTENKLTVTDNGCGFSSRDEILDVFETFGLPHEKGDATYGRFRVGRGQVMAFGKVSWRSGHYEMIADLVSESESFGYMLHEHKDAVTGCQVTVTGTAPDDFNNPLARCGHFAGMLKRSIRYIDVPVTFNGKQISTPPSEVSWLREDDHAYYNLNRSDWRLDVYNKGVYAFSLPSHELGVAGVISTKHHLELNMARNTVLYGCPTWGHIKDQVQAYYHKTIMDFQRLRDHEIPALLEWIVESDDPIPADVRKKLVKVKFLDDVFGNKQSPEKMLTADCLTLYDGHNINTAEHVHRSGMASVIMPKTVGLLYGSASSERAQHMCNRLMSRLDVMHPMYSHFQPFHYFVEALDDMTLHIQDKELSEEEALILRVLRVLNRKIYELAGATGRIRKIMAGKSDRADAWTDGFSLIGLDRDVLKSVRRRDGGAARILALMVHEYCHGDASTGTHSHDYAFYQQFHEAILSPQFGALVDSFFRRYMSALARRGIQPASHHQEYVNRFKKLSSQLPSR
ncbi:MULTISPECIES: ATP-binding protein [Halomonadaceae]|uniref:ATP-binding protein n=1 Tax=Halomonadaceae TaxID=28256 RepID=UPI003FD83B9E